MTKTLFRLSPFAILCSLFLLGCGKPNEPEVLPGDGGYKIVSRFQTPGWAQDLVVRDTLAYVAQGEGGLIIISTKDARNPSTVSIAPVGARGYSYKIAQKDNAIYLAAGNFGVTVIDVANPAIPQVSGENLAMKPARDFCVIGTFLLTAVSELGVKISDISAPLYPDIRGGFSVPGYGRGLWMVPDSRYLLVACGEMGMAIMDTAGLQDGWGILRRISWLDTPGYAEAITTKGLEHIALLACGDAGMQVVDFRDTTNVRIVGSYQTGGYAKEIAYRDQRAYITTETKGLQVLSVENPSLPRLVGIVKTDFARGVVVDSSYVYVADEIQGLVIISIPKN
jgi:hypothetical protein